MTTQLSFSSADTARSAPGVAFDLMGQFGVRMSFARDEEIYAQEESAELIYQVVSGAVRTTRLMADGRRQIGDFYYPGDVFGIENAKEHRFSAEALCDTVVIVVKRSALTLAAGKDAVDRFITEAVMAELDRAQKHVLLLGRKTACEKVASFLLDIAERAKARPAELPMGRQDMADYLGLTIETVSRMVTQLQSADIVEFPTCRQFSVKNRAALERLSE
jgi:CRP/FNR family nitrogen fixation transcriptional regulator